MMLCDLNASSFLASKVSQSFENKGVNVKEIEQEMRGEALEDGFYLEYDQEVKGKKERKCTVTLSVVQLKNGKQLEKPVLKMKGYAWRNCKKALSRAVTDGLEKYSSAFQCK